jgi:preprotein translocase subunit SecB
MDKLEPKESVISFLNYIIKDLSFSANPNFKPLDNATVELVLNLSHSAEIDMDTCSAAIGLGCSVSKGPEGNQPFNMQIELVGFFSFSSGVDEAQATNLLRVNTTAILFPYLRAIVSNITALSGFGAVILPIFNVQKMFGAEADKAPAVKN